MYIEGNRSRRRQEKKWIDNVKEDLKKQKLNMRRTIDQIETEKVEDIFVQPYHRHMADERRGRDRPYVVEPSV